MKSICPTIPAPVAGLGSCLATGPASSAPGAGIFAAQRAPTTCATCAHRQGRECLRILVRRRPMPVKRWVRGCTLWDGSVQMKLLLEAAR